MILTFSCCLPLVLSIHAETAEESVPKEGNTYYFSQLQSDTARNFYCAIQDMEKSGLLFDGISEYDLIQAGVLTAAEAAGYREDGSALLQEFGAGRDAYVMDHVDNFYTDFSKLTLSIGTKADGTVTATLGTGRDDNYLIDGGLTSHSKIADAKDILGQTLDSLLPGDPDSMSDAEKVAAANRILFDRVTYSFCLSEETAAYAPYIRTAYGALVNGYAVCEGYARALKMLLDEMGVTNVLVYGYLVSETGALEPHMWNSVEISHKWYAVDPTVNSTMKIEQASFLQGGDEFDFDHISDGVISAAGFAFSYPKLSKYGYGKEELPTVVDYKGIAEEKMLCVTVSYNGKSATELAKDGLYLAVNYSTQTSTADQIDWGGFASLSCIMKYMPEDAFEETEEETVLKDWGAVPYMKFAVISQPPADELGKFGELPDEAILCESDVIINEAYDGIVAAPFAYRVSPANTAKMDITQTYHITLTYDEPLVKTDGEEVTVDVTSTHGATSAEYQLSNVVWNEESNELSFDFRPSRMFLHNGEGYSFTPVNLVGRDSRKQPHGVSYSFQYTAVVCNKILENGRLYMDIYGHPTLIDNSDLSMENWTLNGEQVGENQRSQLALVVTSLSAEDTSDALSGIANDAGVSENEILSASTYEIDLDLCGFLTKVPTGSYMKISFGFPAGYSSKDAGVTFKLYHFKRGTDGKIDPTKTTEIPCVITEYGLVAEISDFSPFAVVALSTDKVETKRKGIYSRTIGNGGSVKTVGSSSNIAFMKDGESVTFALTPKPGYQVDYVLLNQKEIPYSGGQVTLHASELGDNNLLEVAFVASRVAAYEKENGIVNLQKEWLTHTGLSQAEQPPVLPASDDSAKVIVVVTVVGILGALVIIGTVAMLVRHGKQTKKKR